MTEFWNAFAATTAFSLPAVRLANVRLSELTTLRVGGEIADYRKVSAESEIISAVRECDEAGKKVLILAGGSNICASDSLFDGTVIHIVSNGTSLTRDACSGGTITVAAGHSWDQFVDSVIEFGFAGVEALSGIPGSVGATPIQNVGAYGQQVSDSIARVRTYDRVEKSVKTFAASECGFGYRTSRFKEDRDRYIVLDVTFQLRNASLSQPIEYQELADYLGVAVGERKPLNEVREAVLALRTRKGMVLSDDDLDTWSAGSFFMNPIVNQAPEGAPTWPQQDGRVKTSAAWLIEQSGFSKGFVHGGAGVSTKHTLALTNRGSATGEEIIALATRISEAVKSKFEIELQPEVRLVGLSLAQ